MCIFGSRILVPVSWMCKKQSSVSHSSTESEIFSLDAMLIEVQRSTINKVQPNHNGILETGAISQSKAKIQNDKRRQKVDPLSEVDYVPTNTHVLHKVILSCTLMKTMKLSSK